MILSDFYHFSEPTTFRYQYELLIWRKKVYIKNSVLSISKKILIKSQFLFDSLRVLQFYSVYLIIYKMKDRQKRYYSGIILI